MMNSKLNTLAARLTVAATFLAAGAALAQHGEEHGANVEHGAGPAAGHGLAHGASHAGHEPHVSNWWALGEDYKETPALGWLFITFFVFVGIIVVFGRKPLQVYLETRAKDVQKAIDEAKAAKEDAERRAREAEAKYAALEAETRRLKSDFEAQGKAELDRLVQVGKDASARIVRDAEDTINAETERARSVLRREAAKLALEIAEQRIQRALTPDDDARLQKALVQDLKSDSGDKPRALNA
jgi:F-type H+-transporting ATPase subunit b